MLKRFAFLLLLSITAAGSVLAQSVDPQAWAVKPAADSASSVNRIYIVRHAEKASEDRDPPLSDTGKQRADCLAQTLRDANVQAVFVSQYQRTQLTAAPLLRNSHAKQEIIPADQPNVIADKARSSLTSGSVLIVGHSDTIPAILKSLGGPVVPNTTYDSLYVVDVAAPQQALTLHYCPDLNSSSASATMK